MSRYGEACYDCVHFEHPYGNKYCKECRADEAPSGWCGL